MNIHNLFTYSQLLTLVISSALYDVLLWWKALRYAGNRKWFETCALLLRVSLNVTSAVCCSLMQTWVRQTAAFFSGDWREWRWHTHFCCATLLRDCRQMGQMDWCCPSLWASVCVYTHPCMFTCLSPLWSLAHTLQELDFDFDLSGRLCLVSTRRELHASLSSVRSINIDCIAWSKKRGAMASAFSGVGLGHVL